MSWNSSIQFAKLYKAFLTLSTTALTNPMVANLNMATYSINNVNTISAVSGNTLSLSADASQGITVNTKLLIPNHPLVITNNTVNDSLQVHDTTSDTTIFRVDYEGNVAIKSNTSTTLTDTFTVNGNSSFTGSITSVGFSSTTGAFSTSLTAPTRSSGDNTTNVATTAFVTGAVGVTSIVAGNGISVSGTSAVTVTNNIVGGTGISITGTNPLTIASTVSLRNSSLLNINYTGVPSVVLNNFSPFNVANIGSSLIPITLNDCNVFTIYIREMGVQSTSTASGPVDFIIYPSTTPSSQWNSNEGAISFQEFRTNPSTTVNAERKIVFNWKPSSSLAGVIYFNAVSVTTSDSSTTSISSVFFYYDVVGTKTTLV